MRVENDEVFEDRVLLPEREVRPALHEDEDEVDEDREGQLDFATRPVRVLRRRQVSVVPGPGIAVHESAFRSGAFGWCIHRRFSFVCCVSAGAPASIPYYTEEP